MLLISREEGERVYGFAFIFRLHSSILLLTVYIVIAMSSSNLFIVKMLIVHLPCFLLKLNKYKVNSECFQISH